MNKADLAAYKEHLERERARLLKEIGEESRPTDFGSDVDGFDQEADEAEEFGSQLAVAQTLKTRVEKINLALARIAKGTYGICSSCQRPIEKEVLEAAPESGLCKACKEKAARAKR